MRIALVTGEYPPTPGGVGDYTRRLGEALVARGHQVFVCTIHDLRFTIYDLQFAVDDLRTNHQLSTTNLQPSTSNWGWKSWGAIIDALDTIRPDILHIQYQTGAYAMHPAINFLPWRLRALPSRPAILVTAHDLLVPYLFPKAGPLRDWVNRRLLADADVAVLTNEEDYERVARGWGLGARDWALGTRKEKFNYSSQSPIPNPQSPIPNTQSPTLIPIGSNIPVAPPDGYDRAAWRTRLGVAQSERLIAYFGLISPTKGLDTLLDALNQLPERFRLLVIGGAATAPQDQVFAETMRQRLAELGARVYVTGYCSEEEVSAHLLAADVAALPFSDGASLRRGSLLASLAHDLPVVTTARPNSTAEAGTWQATLNRCVLLIRPGDAASLAKAIEQLDGDVALGEQLRANGRALMEQLSWEAIADRHEELYHIKTRSTF